MEERGYGAAALMTSEKHTSFPATKVVSLQFTHKGMFWKKEGVNGQSHSVGGKAVERHCAFPLWIFFMCLHHSFMELDLPCFVSVQFEVVIPT